MGLAIGKTYTIKGVGTFKVQKATAKGKAKKVSKVETFFKYTHQKSYENT